MIGTADDSRPQTSLWRKPGGVNSRSEAKHVDVFGSHIPYRAAQTLEKEETRARLAFHVSCSRTPPSPPSCKNAKKGNSAATCAKTCNLGSAVTVAYMIDES